MRLPSTTDPEGLLTWLLAFLIVSAFVFLALFAAGLWTA